LNKRTFTGGLLAALLVAFAAACSSGPATNTTNTAATNANAANRAATPASTPAATNANNANTTSETSGAQDFTLVNRTGVEIHALHVAPHESDNWEEDVLGRDTLPDGQSVDIKFNRSEKAAMWDLRIEDKDGNHIEWENLNLLQISKVTLFYKDGKGTPWDVRFLDYTSPATGELGSMPFAAHAASTCSRATAARRGTIRPSAPRTMT